MRTTSQARCRIDSAMPAMSRVRSSAPARRRRSEYVTRDGSDGRVTRSASHLITYHCITSMKVTVAATQFACTEDRAANLATPSGSFAVPRAGREHHPHPGTVRDAVLLQGARPEVFRARDADRRESGRASFPGARARARTSCCRQALRARRQCVLQLVAIIDADGCVLGTYRKAHIPESPGYHEKFYFSPGDTGFKVWPHALRHDRRRDLLGSMVSRVGARDGAAGR